MTLAESISHALGGKRSGKGYRIPAFWRDSTDFNIYIADGADGSLVATDHSHGDSYETIMLALEGAGLKPKNNDYNVLAFKQKATRGQLRNALQIEAHVALQFLNDRAGDSVKQSDRNYLKLHPEYVPLPDELLERESQAYRRIIKVLGQLL